MSGKGSKRYFEWFLDDLKVNHLLCLTRERCSFYVERFRQRAMEKDCGNFSERGTNRGLWAIWKLLDANVRIWCDIKVAILSGHWR
jgi:hypothetical protein